MGEVIQPPYQVEVELTPDGYYRAVGNLTFYPSHEDQNVTFGCKVSHSGNYQELDFQLSITRESLRVTVSILVALMPHGLSVFLTVLLILHPLSLHNVTSVL